MFKSLDRIGERIKGLRRKAAAVKQIRRMHQPYKLHIGCGDVHFPGWVHLDTNLRIRHLDILWHSDDGLPCTDQSCEFIYNEHFLEHLTIDQGKFLLAECRRALRPGGVLRIAMPDLTENVRQYWENDWAEQPWLEKYGYAWIKTRSEFLNIVFREWEHKWLYDQEELERRLFEVGFTSVKRMRWKESKYEDLKDRESRIESILIVEASY